MIERCTRKTSKAWPRYGGRGIKVCDEWRHDFPRFVADMGERPAGMTLERIDNDGDYRPGNVKWATRKEQARNTSTVNRISIEGREHLVVELAERAGVKPDTILHRFRRGLSFDEIVYSGRFVDQSGLALKQVKHASNFCRHGHEYTAENIYIGNNGYRQCRACNRVNDLKRQEKRRNKG